MPDIEFLVGKVNAAGAASMATKRSRHRFALFKIPRTVLVVNYFGIPTVGSISFFGRKGFFPLRKYGPNDGALLLADMIFPGGVTLARLGSDHTQMNDHIDIATVALTMTVIGWLRNDKISPTASTDAHPTEASAARGNVSSNGPANQAGNVARASRP